MLASDLVLLASGTATLEAMLLKKPMVVAYKMNELSYAILKPFIKAPHVALPNLLSNERLVPELLQNEATVDAITAALRPMIDDSSYVELLTERFMELHQDLKRDASSRAADAILQLISG